MKWEYSTPGIPDRCFNKENSPMTKEEIRAITLSKARIKESSIVYDIGAGTGSISIEVALLAKKGHVYSIEKNKDRRSIIEKNIQKFGVKNIEIVNGEAPQILEGLPKASRIIIGGSGGRIKEILRKCSEKLNKRGVIVINAITLDTLNNAISTLEDLNFELDIIQVAITKIRKIGTKKMLEARNPVFVIQGLRGK